jgi:hypothetical protein
MLRLVRLVRVILLSRAWLGGFLSLKSIVCARKLTRTCIARVAHPRTCIENRYERVINMRAAIMGSEGREGGARTRGQAGSRARVLARRRYARRLCVRACVRPCVRACVRACVRWDGHRWLSWGRSGRGQPSRTVPTELLVVQVNKPRAAHGDDVRKGGRTHTHRGT